MSPSLCHLEVVDPAGYCWDSVNGGSNNRQAHQSDQRCQPDGRAKKIFINKICGLEFGDSTLEEFLAAASFLVAFKIALTFNIHGPETHTLGKRTPTTRRYVRRSERKEEKPNSQVDIDATPTRRSRFRTPRCAKEARGRVTEHKRGQGARSWSVQVTAAATAHEPQARRPSVWIIWSKSRRRRSTISTWTKFCKFLDSPSRPCLSYRFRYLHGR